MASIRFTMEVIPAKQQELLQALYELRSAMHTEKGFLDARVCLHSTSHMLTFVEEWETREALQAYLHSRYFQILQGAMQLLTASSEIIFGPPPSTSTTIHPGMPLTGQKHERTPRRL